MVIVKVGPDEYDVWVECGGKRLEEWAPKCQEHQQECWIASEEGKVRCARSFCDANRVATGIVEVSGCY